MADLEAFLRDAAADEPGARRRARLRALASATEIDATHPLVVGAARGERGSCSATSVPRRLPGRDRRASLPAHGRDPDGRGLRPGLPAARARAERERAGGRDPAGGRAVRARGAAVRRGGMTVVDAHAHVFAAVSERFPRDVHELFPAEAEATAEELLAEMERAASTAPCSCRSPITTSTCATASSGSRAASPRSACRARAVDVEAYRRRREAAGSRGCACSRSASRAAARPSSTRSRCSRSSRGPATSSGSTAAASRWSCSSACSSELPELTVVLNHLGFWPTAFHADEHGRPRFDTTYTSEGLERDRPRPLPACLRPLTGMYAFAAGPCPYDDLRPVTSSLLEAYGPGRAPARHRLPVDPGRARVRGDDRRRGRAPRRARRGGSRPGPRRERYGALLVTLARRLL